MNKNLLAVILISAFVTPALADKPEWAGKGEPAAEQKAAHEAAMGAKDNLEGDDLDSDDLVKEKKYKSNELKGLDKQSAKKSEQTRHELDKGSEKGKEAREENSKKWWKFWGE